MMATKSTTNKVTLFTMEKTGASTVKYALEKAGFLVDRRYIANRKGLDPDTLVITMVRDPMARAISAHFENKRHGFPSLYDEEHRVPEFFFVALRHLFNIDVFNKPFPQLQGWKVYGDRVLLIQTEALTNHLRDGILELTGVDVGTVEHRAKGVDRFDKSYEAATSAKYQREDVLWYYARHPFVSHFYDHRVIHSFVQRWSR